MKRTIKILMNVCSSFALAGLVLFSNGWAQTMKTVEATKPAAVTRLKVSYKLDPRLSGPTYGGERWISPPTYMGAAAQDTVQARVEGTGLQGQPVRVNAKWTPSDPEMVSVSPSEGGVVTITVKRPGDSTLEVASQGMSKNLSIRAEQKNNVLQILLSQTQ